MTPFTPAGPAGDPRPFLALTLREFFETCYRPYFLQEASPRTLEAYREALAWWERAFSDPDPDHAGPPLARIGPPELAAVRATLLGTGEVCSLSSPAPAQRLLFPELSRDPEQQQRNTSAPPGGRPARMPSPQGRRRRGAGPLARATANKHLGALNAIFRKIGPPGYKNLDALGLLERAPWLKPLKEPRRLPRAVAVAELGAIYAACAIATKPAAPAIDPAAWWRALVAVAAIAGLRREALLGLRWADCDLAGRTLRVPAEIDKCRQERSKPIPAAVCQHLMRIRTAAERVFAWPHSLASLYRQWWAIQKAAGIARADRLRLHDLKRFAGTFWAAHASPWAVQQILDHSSLATSAHYVNPRDELRAVADRLPLPDFLCGGGGEEPNGPAAAGG
jgi:integrase